MEKDNDNFDLKEAINATTVNIEKETINRFGSAAKEHIVAYNGIDNETGKTLNRSLKDISNSKINPKYEQQNYKQQAGFSAEIKETARENAERIKEGKHTRTTRTDDIGRVNDPLYDHVELDEHGNVIEGSGSQMKFVGKNADECLNKLMSEKYQKYRDKGFSAEIKENAERIKEGKHTRTTRTDDINRVNDPLYDHVELDEYGNVIEGSGSQMKFVGKNADECLNKLMR